MLLLYHLFFFVLQILKAPCLLLSLFTSLNLCSGKFMTPITDDVSKLSLLVRLLSCYRLEKYHIQTSWLYIYSYTYIMLQKCFSVIHFYRRSRISPLIMRSLLATFPKTWYVWKRECRNNVKQSNIHEENLDLIYWRGGVIFFSQAGTCWVVLNIYPLEQSLRKLANMFGAISSNKEHIIVFIAMLKSLRFTFDHEELVSVLPCSRWAFSDHCLPD